MASDGCVPVVTPPLGLERDASCDVCGDAARPSSTSAEPSTTAWPPPLLAPAPGREVAVVAGTPAHGTESRPIALPTPASIPSSGAFASTGACGDAWVPVLAAAWAATIAALMRLRF